MKKAYAPEDIIVAVKNLDKRTLTLSDSIINNIIDDGYTELCTTVQAFSDEEVVDLSPYIEEGEALITLDIEEDVSDIYDLYITVENQDKHSYDYGIEKLRDSRLIYKDNRYNGRVHIDLDMTSVPVNNAILKYYYVPTHTSETVYMDAQTWLAFKSALGVAVYDTLHDVERNGQKRSEMIRRARAIMPKLPEDGTDPSYGHIFAGLSV